MNKTLGIISPVNGKEYIYRNLVTRAEAFEAVALARRVQPQWAACPLEKRIEQVRAAIAALREMNSEIVTELAWSIGRPVRYGGEIAGVEERAHYMADIAEAALADQVIEWGNHTHRYIKREPLGVVMVIAPWNYPYLTAINTLVPALIAGNTVVLKHAAQTLLAGERLAKAFAMAGLPEGVFTNLLIDHETTGELIAQRCFNFINFTGSVSGGRAIERVAAGTFTGVALELGGKDPAYVMADADLDLAVQGLVEGAMYNSGQCCCGIERIYVADRVFDAFVEKALTLTSGYVLGNPLDPNTTLGPMAHRRFALKVREQIKEALAAGARGLIDPSGFAADDGGAYLAPQILVGVDHSMRVMREESFGPVVGIMKVSSDPEAIALMNDSDFGLTASLWTRDMERAAAIGSQLQVGTVFMNRCDYVDPGLCWAGRKDTGRGGALSALGYTNLTQSKSYHLTKGATL